MGEEEVEFLGRTVEDATVEAERALGIQRDHLDIVVISPGSRGVFGLGAEQARIRAAVLIQSEDAGSADPEGNGWNDPEVSPEVEEGEVRASTGLTSGPELAENARQVLTELLETMSIEADITVRSEQEPVTLVINGENLGVLIGRRGDNLAALQFVVNLILSKNRRQWPRVVLDVENYRERREESLKSLADRIAYRVRGSQRPFTLEAMPAGDRRVVHLALKDRSDVETYSIGEGPSRRVVVAPKKSAPVAAE